MNFQVKAQHSEREREQWAVHYTSPQSFMITFSHWGLLIGGFMKLSVQTFQPLILIYRRGKFVCIIIEDVHKFIDHCLIPLDPCTLTQTHTHTPNYTHTHTHKQCNLYTIMYKHFCSSYFIVNLFKLTLE